MRKRGNYSTIQKNMVNFLTIRKCINVFGNTGRNKQII